MANTTGTPPGPHEIQPPTEAGGGLGVVYRALDTRLGRRVGPALVVILLLCGCSSEPSPALSSASISNPAVTPGELLELGAQMESLDSLVEALRAYDSCIARTGRTTGEERMHTRGLLARARLSLLLGLNARAVFDSDSALALQLTHMHTTGERGSAWLFKAGGLEGEQRLTQADSASDSSLSLLSALTPPDTGLLVDALILRGRILVGLKRPAEAEPLLAGAMDMSPAETRAQRHWEAQSLLGLCLVREGRLEEAEPALLRSFLGFSGALGNEDPLTRAAAARTAELYERWEKHDLFAHYQGIATHSEHPEDEE